jgi:hypothetical protein
LGAGYNRGMARYRVVAADNAHYMDEDEYSDRGEFDTKSAARRCAARRLELARKRRQGFRLGAGEDCITWRVG